MNYSTIPISLGLYPKAASQTAAAHYANEQAQALEYLRLHYPEDRHLFQSMERARLQFLCWLIQQQCRAGRLLGAAIAPLESTYLTPDTNTRRLS
jgi:hypothetical protein